MVAMVAAAADAAESALVVACASDADDRTFVFPGERVLISFSFPYEGEDLDHGYALTLTPTTTTKEEGDKVLVTIEASVPTRFGSLSRCPATLDLKQYLRHPLGVGAVGAGAHREELHEDFLCRRWTKAV